jgi:hypothetical protein
MKGPTSKTNKQVSCYLSILGLRAVTVTATDSVTVTVLIPTDNVCNRAFCFKISRSPGDGIKDYCTVSKRICPAITLACWVQRMGSRSRSRSHGHGHGIFSNISRSRCSSNFHKYVCGFLSFCFLNKVTSL